MGIIICFIRIFGNGYKSGYCNNSKKELVIGKELFEMMYFNIRIVGVEGLIEMEWFG